MTLCCCYGHASVSLSARLSVSVCHMSDGSIWFLAWWLLSASPTDFIRTSGGAEYNLAYKKIKLSTKIRLLPPGTFSLTPDLENLATKLVINLVGERWTIGA